MHSFKWPSRMVREGGATKKIRSRLSIDWFIIKQGGFDGAITVRYAFDPIHSSK